MRPTFAGDRLGGACGSGTSQTGGVPGHKAVRLVRMEVPIRARRRCALACVLAVAVLAVAPSIRAEDIDWKKGALQHLARYIGTYDYEAVLDDPAVRAALMKRAGAHTDRIVANLQTRGPIDFIDGYLVLTGLAPHRGGEEEATVWIRIYDGEVRAALLHAGTMTLFAPEQHFHYLPKLLRAFLVPRNAGVYDAPPRGLVWIGRMR